MSLVRITYKSCALLWLFAASTAFAAPSAPRSDIKLATWNLEWLIAPQALAKLKGSCIPSGERPRGATRYVPCDAVAANERGSADFQALASYARKLDADVVALQEVDGPDAARLVFPDYAFCFSGRQNVQNNGFAIRKSVPFRCGPDLDALSLNNTVRRGKVVVLYPGTPREIHLLSVHLKSGCGQRPLDSGRRECNGLAQQAVTLEAWIDAQAKAGRRFAILGDFNRDLQKEGRVARSPSGQIRNFWAEIDDGDPAASDMVNAADGERFVNCAMDQSFSGYIDYILLSASLARDRVPGSFGRVTYETRDARRRRLSDHCPVAVRVRTAPLVRMAD